MATLFLAEAAGMADGLTHNAPRTVPPQFASPALADAYLEAFDRMRQSLRGCVPDTKKRRIPEEKPPTAAGKPTKAKAAAVVAPEPAPQAKPGMDGVLDALLLKSA